MAGAGNSVGHRPAPGGRWDFDAGVADVFDDMLRRSIPQYETMRELTTTLAARHIQDGTDVVDLGCSRGEALIRIALRPEAKRARMLLGVECSEPMADAAASRFRAASDESGLLMQVWRGDLRREYPAAVPSVVLSVLTLQFVPVEHRQAVIATTFDRLRPGGAFVLVEKVLGATARLQNELVGRYHDLKHANGYSAEDIEAKRASLEGVLVPLTAAANESALSAAGFRHIECVWRWCNFAAWLAIKGE